MNTEQREQRPYRSDCGVWMESSGDSQSVARAIAVDVMRGLGLDYINDFRTRDNIICAIGNRIDCTLDDAIALGTTLTPEQMERAKEVVARHDRSILHERKITVTEIKAVTLLREIIENE